MRATLTCFGFGLGLGVAVLAGGGCKWTDFDDLKEDTWVTATGKPDSKAASWGVSIARINRGASGGTLGVLGASEPTFARIVIGPNGDTNIGSEVLVNRSFAANLPIEPLFLSNPTGDQVILATGTIDSRITVLRSSETGLEERIITGSTMQPSAATFLVAPSGVTQALVAHGDTVFAAPLDDAAQAKCKLVDDTGAALEVRAMGAYRRTGTSDDVLVLSATGKLMVYPGSLFAGCGAGTQAPLAGLTLDTMFTGALSGSQILTFEDPAGTFALIQAHSDSKGHIGLYKLDAAITLVGSARADAGVRQIAIFEPPSSTKRYVIAGFPTALVEGVAAGQVLLFDLDTTAGIGNAPALTLSDAQPEDNQSFGRSVASLPYNGSNIIAVAADNDVFLYFRTSLYGETRQGR